jgi:methylase of polypeptide subunit release factors
MDDAARDAALHLLAALERAGYDFVPVTPASQQRVVARPTMDVARDLRGIFGWSLPFDSGLLPTGMLVAMEQAGFVERRGELRRSRVRASRVRGMLFLHSAFPTVEADSVFLGPDSVRFADFLARELDGGRPPDRLVDIGAGAGVGGIVAARQLGHAAPELADINPAALRLAEVNAIHAGIEPRLCECDGLAGIQPGFDLAVANPPFISGGGPAYRDGGGMTGAELSLRWALDAAEKLAPGGRLLLYTGSAVAKGRDRLKAELEAKLAPLGASLRYAEIDPDIFGEELEKPGYEEVERIAAVGAVITKSEG